MPLTKRKGDGESRPSTLLAIDPGETTGWAAFQRDGEKWKHVALGQFSGSLSPTMLENRDVVVVEETPMGRGLPIQREIILDVYRLVEGTETEALGIYPGQWKPWAKARGADEAAKEHAAGMKHARDALCMGAYVIWKEGL